MKECMTRRHYRGTWEAVERTKHVIDIHFAVLATPSEGVSGGNTVSDKDGSVALSHHEMHLNV